MCNKGAGDKTWLVVVFFWSLACRGTLKPSLFFFGEGKCVKCTRLCDVGRRGMLVNSNCDDPQAHCAAQGDAVGDVGQLRLQCLLGDATRCEGAQSRTLILHATGTRVPDTVRWGQNHG